eukprot:6650543-Lingulodinium_polyedra.AAC.1
MEPATLAQSPAPRATGGGASWPRARRSGRAARRMGPGPTTSSSPTRSCTPVARAGVTDRPPAPP